MEQAKYNNMISQQNLYFLNNLKTILNDIKPHRIIEIGTSRGATTLLLSDLLVELGLPDSKIKSFDIHKRPHLRDVSRSNLELYIGNIFIYHETKLSNPEEIVDFLSRDKVNLILCDGGNKIAEFNILSQYLKKGDIIMAHDYSPDKDTFNKEYKDKIWNWLEISDKDIEDSVNQYNLEPYNMELIKPTAWVAKIKK